MTLQLVRSKTWIAAPALAVALFACGGVARVAPTSTFSPSASITKALARIAKKVSVPIELPAGLPPDIHLAGKHPVYIVDYGPNRMVGVLNLEFGREGRLTIS